MQNYDSTFFKYVNSGSITSAENLLPTLKHTLDITSVLDVGCGLGAWLSVWDKLGINNYIGVDGEYVDQSTLLIPKSKFIAADLANGLDINRRFSLVQSLEVAEHLPTESSTEFIKSLTRHGDIILFYAAPEGQGGDHHINKQPYDYWRAIFKQFRYTAYDFVRPYIRNNFKIEPWYRYNTFIYISDTLTDRLPPSLLETRVPDEKRLVDISPLFYKIRKLIIKSLPVSLVTKLAKLNEKITSSRRSVA